LSCPTSTWPVPAGIMQQHSNRHVQQQRRHNMRCSHEYCSAGDKCKSGSNQRAAEVCCWHSAAQPAHLCHHHLPAAYGTPPTHITAQHWRACRSHSQHKPVANTVDISVVHRLGLEPAAVRSRENVTTAWHQLWFIKRNMLGQVQ
jgi:hypothetical protein